MSSARAVPHRRERRAAVASVPFQVGGVLLLIGIVGCGVYIGLRQHVEWLESREQ